MNPPSKLDTLNVWWHHGVRSAAQNLAVDEALLTQLDERPTLRFYQWSHQLGEAWTMGYFQRWAELPLALQSENPEIRSLDIARRWTGGGLVCHRGDFPYTLAVPAGHWLAQMPATDSYRWIHDHLARSISETTGMAAVAQPILSEGSKAPLEACFEKPVLWDVTSSAGASSPGAEKKIAGAAQRRSQGRLLHQGSVILPNLTGTEDGAPSTLSWRQAFAQLLGDSSQQAWSPGEQLLADAGKLERDRYGCQQWQQRF